LSLSLDVQKLKSSAPGPRWGHSPQTPVIGSRSRARHGRLHPSPPGFFRFPPGSWGARIITDLTLTLSLIFSGFLNYFFLFFIFFSKPSFTRCYHATQSAVRYHLSVRLSVCFRNQGCSLGLDVSVSRRSPDAFSQPI